MNLFSHIHSWRAGAWAGGNILTLLSKYSAGPRTLQSLLSVVVTNSQFQFPIPDRTKSCLWKNLWKISPHFVENITA
ncbi:MULTISPECIES: hypothetical protein [unclassified Microcoleus]|uniref:hypothetical protein n=1 Tax=unclassified Microcoleus TaxID=2642155 RepID=UPI002FD46508